jgi:hypothetical protein
MSDLELPMNIYLKQRILELEHFVQEKKQNLVRLMQK